jgi:hypothetical protein
MAAKKAVKKTAKKAVKKTAKKAVKKAATKRGVGASSKGKGSAGKAKKTAKKSVKRTRAPKSTAGDAPGATALTAEQLLTYLTDHGGLHIEQIAEALGKTTQELALPMRELLDARKVIANGENEETRYYAVGRG